MKRKKRLEKGITSLEKQIILHEEKMKNAIEIGKEELVGYYSKEIEALKDRKKDREEKRRKLKIK